MKRSVQVRNKRYDLARRVIREGAQNGIKKIVLAIEAHAASNAPYDTGNLSASIYSETVDESGVTRAHASVESNGFEPAVVDVEINEDLKGKVAAAAHYATYVELGTANVDADGNYTSTRNYQHPFLDPAVETVRPEVDKIIAREIKKAVSKP